jgi:hypothetical protein
MSEHKHRESPDQEFEALFKTLDMATVSLIDYKLSFPKEDFLRFVVYQKEALLHGSSQNVDVLLPMKANDDVKAFGNKLAVYAVDDPVLAIFYAIQDRSCIHGPVISGRTADEFFGDYSYNFAIPDEAGENPWSSGFVYVVGRDGFEEGRQDDGKSADEWCSYAPVRPWAKLCVNPADFRFLNQIQRLGLKL